MIISKHRNRYGQLYSYFVCLGRHQKRTDCTFRAVAIEAVEEKVIEHYATVQLTPGLRALIEARLNEDFAIYRREIELERGALDKYKRRLLREREKLLQAHYADALPLDLLRSEQTRIAEELERINQRFGSTDEQEAIIAFNLRRTLDLATDVQWAYRESDAAYRRLLNQSFFRKLFVHDDHIESELAEPYDILLNPTLKARVTAPTPAGLASATGEPDWSEWETSFNDTTREEVLLTGVGVPRRPSGRRGSNNAILVGAGGFEPP